MISFQIGTSQQAFAHYIREAIRQWHCQRRWLPGRYKIKTNSLKSRTLTEIFFQSWEKNDDPAEQEGKGVAIKSCTQFFTWLKEVRHSLISSDVPFSIIFVSGGGGGGRLVGCGCCGDICKKSFAPRRIEIQTVALSYSRPALCWHDNGRLMSNVGSIQKW